MSNLQDRAVNEIGYLASVHNLDFDRLKGVFDRISSLKFSNVYLQDLIAGQYPEFTPFHESLAVISPQQTLELFERDDIERIVERSFVYKYLTNNNTPCFSHPGLSDLINKYIQHLEKNRYSLIKTGYPETCFSESGWLDELLGMLYFVKIPILINSTHIHVALNKYIDADFSFLKKNSDGEYLLEYAWTKSPANCIDYMSPVPSFPHKMDSEKNIVSREGSPIGTCTYEEAPYFVGLESFYADKLEKMREKVHVLKINILKQLTNIGSGHNDKALWSDCFRVIKNGLTGTEVDFLLKRDKCYALLRSDGHPFDSSHIDLSDNWGRYSPGGFGAILSFIQYVCKEAKLGTMEKVAGKFMFIKQINNMPSSYYEVVIDSGMQQQIDSAIEIFLDEKIRKKEFYDEFCLTRDSSFQNQLNELITIPPLEIPRWLLNSQFDLDENIKHLVCNRINEVIRNNAESDLYNAASSQNIFYKQGDVWKIRFNGGKYFYLKHTKGLAYIHEILKNQGHNIYIMKLLKVDENEVGDSRLIGEAFDQSITRNDNSGMLDILKKQQASLKQQLMKEELREDEHKILEIKEELRMINEQISSLIYQNDEYKRPRDAISKAVERAYKEIQKNDEDFYQELNLYISKGQKFGYFPTQKREWKLFAD